MRKDQSAKNEAHDSTLAQTHRYMIESNTRLETVLVNPDPEFSHGDSHVLSCPSLSALALSSTSLSSPFSNLSSLFALSMFAAQLRLHCRRRQAGGCGQQPDLRQEASGPLPQPALHGTRQSCFFRCVCSRVSLCAAALLSVLLIFCHANETCSHALNRGFAA